MLLWLHNAYEPAYKLFTYGIVIDVYAVRIGIGFDGTVIIITIIKVATWNHAICTGF